jgi:hypothetical protein
MLVQAGPGSSPSDGSVKWPRSASLMIISTYVLCLEYVGHIVSEEIW